MRGAPLDIARTLPDRWMEHVVDYRSTGPLASAIELLQSLVERVGEGAIALRAVQDLAVWLTDIEERRRDSPLPSIGGVLDRLTSTGGTWIVDEAVAERRPDFATKHLFDAAADFEAMESEWWVLDELATYGATPARSVRGPGAFDWRVVHGGIPLPVEVKQKNSVGTTGDRLEWFWKGVSLLPAGRFIHEYTWRWHVAEKARSSEARQMMDALWASRHELRDLLPEAFTQASGPRWWDLDVPLADGQLRLRAAHFTSKASLAIELVANPKLLIDVRKNPDPRVLDCCGFSVGRGWIPEQLDSAIPDFMRVLQGLGMGRQLRSRGPEGLYVVVWWVPFEWEPALTQVWMQAVCDGVSKAGGPPFLVIWPIALFEARKLSWAVSAAAQERFPWLLR